MLLSASFFFGCSSPVCDQRPFETCDIRDLDCQERIRRTVGCLRGATVSELPPVRVVDVDGLEEILRDGTMMTPPMPSMPSPVEQAYVLLRLLPPSEDGASEVQLSELLETVGALYRPEEREVVVVDRGQPADSRASVMLLAHELVHAAQDEESDLDALLREVASTEEDFVLRSRVEGEATLLQVMLSAWIQGFDVEDIDWSGFVESYQLQVQRELDVTDAPGLWASLSAPYFYGTRWQLGRFQDGGVGRVRRTLREPPPESSAELMVNPLDRLRSAARGSVECEPDPGPSGLTLVSVDELGPAMLYAALRPDQWNRNQARAAARAWRGDQLAVYGNDAGEVAALWRIRVEGPQVALDIRRMLIGRGFVITVSEDIVAIGVGSDSVDIVERWGAAEACPAP